jgi:peptidyl-prolyl cis-trans isomerase SurA
MKKLTTIVLLTSSALLSSSFAAVMATAPKQPASKPTSTAMPVNRIVAIVNNGVITQSQLNQQMAIIKAQLTQHHVALPSTEALNKQVLNQLVNRQLQLQLAGRNHIQASNQDINQAIQTIAAQNQTSVSQLYQQQGAIGLSRQAFRQQVRDDIVVQKLQQAAMSSQITITPQEVQNYIQHAQNNPAGQQQYHLGDILIALPSAPSPEQIKAAQQKASTIVAQLHNGANFQQLAAAQSGAQSALKGGDLGWRSMGEIPDAFESAVATLKPGQVAGPVRTGNGFHIIKLFGERTPAATAPAASNSEKQQAEQALFQSKMLEALQGWISQLRAQAYVKIT